MKLTTNDYTLPAGYAWHFVGNTLRDGQPIPRKGKWLTHPGPIAICNSGLHASYDPFDALKYAPGPTLCLVRVEDVRETQDDKLVCSRRMIVARKDITPILRYYARMQALSVVHLLETCPPDVVLDYLVTGDEGLRDAAWDAARDAARAAARDAAWAAAWDAAQAAARAAARAAAQAAAWDAARDAAWDAARDAAWDAAWDESRRVFKSLVYAEFSGVLP